MARRPSQTQTGQAVLDMKIGSAEWWQSQVARFETKRDTEVLDQWQAIDDLYRNDFGQQRGYKAKKGGRPSSLYAKFIQPPRVYGITHAIEAVLFYKNPKFFVSPMTSRQAKLARFFEIALNIEWRMDKRLNQQVRMALRDCIRHGWGITLTDYMAGQDDAARAQARRTQQEAAKALQRDVLAQAGVEDFAEAIVQLGDSIEMPPRMGTIEQTSTSYKDMVCTRRISPYNFVIDPDARYGLDDALWVGRVFDVDADILKKDPNINAKGVEGQYASRNQMNPNQSGVGNVRVGREEITRGGPGAMGGSRVHRGDYRYVTCIELFVRNTDKDGAETWDLKLMAKDHDEWLRESDALYDLGCPYSMCQWNMTGEDLFAQSDIDPALTHILEEKEVRTRFFEWVMRNANDAYAFDAGAIQGWEAKIHAAKRTGVGTMIPMEQTGNRPVRDLFFQLPRTSITADMLNYLALIEKNIEMATGLGPNQQMMAMKSETSATEAAEVAGWARARSQPKADQFEDFVADIARKRMQIVAQEYTTERILHLAGPGAAAMWAKESFERGDIQSGLMVHVDRGSMMPESDQKRQATYSMLLDKAMTNPVFAMIVKTPQVAQRLVEAMGIQDGSELINDVDSQEFAQALMDFQMANGAQGSPPSATPMASSPAEAAQFEGAGV